MSINTGYNSNKNSRSYKNAPPCRGFPAIFFTCESGREKKCQREALELIHHYYYISKSSSADIVTSLNDKQTITAKGKPSEDQLSLDEELKMLRKGAAAEEVLSYERNPKRPRYEAKNARSMKSPFIVHDIGVKGIICIVYALPGSELIPYDDIVTALRPKGDGDAENDFKSEGIIDEVNNEKGSGSEANKSHHWDPIETVRIILKEVGRTESDAKENSDKEKSGQSNVTKQALSSSPPGSRFISRMIPIQATCHASLNEITVVAKELLQNFLNSSNLTTKRNDKITFKIDFKKRNCSHLSRDQIFEALVPLVMGETAENDSRNVPKQKYAVNLTDPDFAIRIEVCKTFCGVSILPRQKWYKNFNLAELIDPSFKTGE